MGWVGEDLEVLDFLGNSTFLYHEARTEIHRGQPGDAEWPTGVVLTSWVVFWAKSLMSLPGLYFWVVLASACWLVCFLCCFLWTENPSLLAVAIFAMHG